MNRKTHATKVESSTWTSTFHQITHLSLQRWSSIQRYGIQISAHRLALSASIFWRTSGLPLWQLEPHSSHCKPCCAVQNQMILKMRRSHASIRQTGSCTSSQLNNGCKTMHKKKISRPRWNNSWKWASQKMSVLRHSNAMMVMSSLHSISCSVVEQATWALLAINELK